MRLSEKGSLDVGAGMNPAMADSAEQSEVARIKPSGGVFGPCADVVNVAFRWSLVAPLAASALPRPDSGANRAPFSPGVESLML